MKTNDPTTHDPKTSDPTIRDPKTSVPKEAGVREAKSREARVREARSREAGIQDEKNSSVGGKKRLPGSEHTNNYIITDELETSDAATCDLKTNACSCVCVYVCVYAYTCMYTNPCSQQSIRINENLTYPPS